MKKVLNVIKANLLVVIVMVVTILALPTMIFFSMKWTSSIHEEVQKRESKNVSDVDGLTVTYEVPAVMPGEQAVSVRTTPNKVSTEQVAQLRRAVYEQSEQIRELAIEYNSEGKRLLIGGDSADDQLFPQPTNESARTRLRREMVAVWPAAHDRLIDDARWGTPPSDAAVLGALERFQNDRIKSIISGRELQEITPEEQEELNAELSQRRLELYRNAAGQLSAYYQPGVFAAVYPWPEGDLPELDLLWEWQFLYWVHEDIVKAIRKANTDSNGNWLPVYRAPVRHVLSIVVDSWNFRNPGRDAPSVGDINDTAPVQSNYEKSFTGRVSWPDAPNPFYDIRYAEVDMIVASSQLPAVLDAFNSTNLMTVTDFDVAEFDPVENFRRGYFYGGDHLVQVHLQIESLWLRHWMKPYMPPSVRDAMGIPQEPEDDPAASEES